MNCEYLAIISELKLEDPSYFKSHNASKLINRIHSSKPELSGYCIALILKEIVTSRRATVEGLIAIGYKAEMHLHDPFLSGMWPHILISKLPADQYASDTEVEWQELGWGDY